MKKILINIMATTGMSLVLLSIGASLFGGRFLFIGSVFQSLLVNTLFHLGVIITHKFESKYAALEIAVDIIYILAVVLIAGVLFDWYSTTPIWLVIIITVFAYLAALVLNMIRVREEVAEINKILQKRSRS